MTFNANGGVIGGTSNTTKDLYTKTGVNVLYTGIRGTTTSNAPTATRTGYTWNGWYTAETGGSKVYSNASTPALQGSVSGYTDSNTKWIITADKTLHAQYTANGYTVTADANGGTIPETEDWTGTGSTATKSLHYDDEYGTLPEPTRAGYTFDGWYIGETKNSSERLQCV